MELNIINETSYKIDEKLLSLIAEKTENILNLQKNYSVSIVFIESDEIQKINREYRNIDKATDVISFALLDSDNMYENMEVENELGDIFINIDAVQEQAKRYEHSEKRELGFLFGHGLLHLLGYDHIEKEEEKVMFGLQEKIIDEVIPRNR